MLRSAFACLFLLIAGCGVAPASLLDPGAGQQTPGPESPLAPGIYVGEATCIEGISGSQCCDFTERLTSPLTITIGPSGLPVEEGQELHVGTITTPEGFGHETAIEVTSLFISNDGIVIQRQQMDIDLDDLGSLDPDDVSHSRSDRYRFISSDALEYITISATTVSAEGDLIVVSLDCRGIARR